MCKMRQLLLVLVMLATVSGITFVPSAVYAEGEKPPEPIVVTNEVNYADVDKGIAPNAVVPGPSGNQMTITNQYYPYWQGKVRSNGWASANFNQPSSSRITCQSFVYNDANQQAPSYANNAGSYGGNNCPATGFSVLGGVVPTNYTTWTKAWWRWSNGVSCDGMAEQTHYES